MAGVVSFPVILIQMCLGGHLVESHRVDDPRDGLPLLLHEPDRWSCHEPTLPRVEGVLHAHRPDKSRQRQYSLVADLQGSVAWVRGKYEVFLS